MIEKKNDEKKIRRKDMERIKKKKCKEKRM